MLSSRSFGPEPCTNTTAGNGPLPLGIESVARSAYSPLETVAGSSVNFDESMYDGRGSGAAFFGGLKYNPDTFPRESYDTCTIASDRSNAHVSCTVVYPLALSTVASF